MQSSQSPTRFAGLALNGGRKEKFYYCVLTHFEAEKRWALEHVGHWEGPSMEAGAPVGTWMIQSHVHHLTVDFPLSSAHCESCTLVCPGESQCPDQVVQGVRKGINDYLAQDQKVIGERPKRYENDRLEREMVQTSLENFWRAPTHHVISRSFKRRLKKGYLPFWNRPIDFWIWSEYYDQLLDIFNYSYDSFGHTSLMLLKHFAYLKRHFPADLKLYEANNFVTLLELFRANVISIKLLRQLQTLETQVTARGEILKILEKKFGLFIYARDYDLMVKSPRAFESLLLAWAGTRLHYKHVEELPAWANPPETSFLIPKFVDK